MHLRALVCISRSPASSHAVLHCSSGGGPRETSWCPTDLVFPSHLPTPRRSSPTSYWFPCSPLTRPDIGLVTAAGTMTGHSIGCAERAISPRLALLLPVRRSRN